MAYIAPSTAEQKVSAGYLIHCPPQAAYEWLRDRAAKSSAESKEMRNLFTSVPDIEEYVLMRRAEPLIDLGLARYARTARAVRRAYIRGGAACRIAAWSNVSARGSSLMTDIWANERDLLRLATHGSIDELSTLAANPALGEQVLSALILRNEYFASLTDKQWTACILGLSKNPRMQEEYGEGRPMDGMAEYSHNKVFSNAWGLAKTLPAEQRWAWVLHELLTSCCLPIGLAKDAPELLERWSIDKERLPEDKYYNPGSSFYLRTRLADLLKPDDSLLASPDAAVRLSFWQRFDPKNYPNWADNMVMVFQETASEIDAHDVLTVAFRNPLLWQSEESREALRSLSWSAPDRRHDMMMPNTFRSFERRRRAEHPEWFRDDDASSSVVPKWTFNETEPAWVSALAERIDSLPTRMAVQPQAVLEPVPARRSWWFYVPWWAWLAAGFFVAKGLPTPH